MLIAYGWSDYIFTLYLRVITGPLVKEVTPQVASQPERDGTRASAQQTIPWKYIS